MGTLCERSVLFRLFMSAMLVVSLFPFAPVTAFANEADSPSLLKAEQAHIECVDPGVLCGGQEDRKSVV